MESLKKAWGSLPLRRFFLLSVLFTVAMAAALSGLVIGVCFSFRHWLLPDANGVYLTVERTYADGTANTGIYFLEYGGSLESLPEILIAEEDSIEDGAFVEGGGYVERQGPAEDEISIEKNGLVESRGYAGQEAGRIRYSIQKMENSYSTLSPKRKAAWQLCGVIMVAAPAFFAFVGILICSMYFYRRKLMQPLEILDGAAEKIAGQDLDFTVAYDCGDEMGSLCCSFEHMRQALHENNKIMWKMLEERRLLQASVAHDLRNPIAIIEGYAEYMDTGLKTGTLSQEKLGHVVSNLHGAAKRLEQYTESVRQLNQSEEEALERRAVQAADLAEGLVEDMSLLAEKKGITLRTQGDLPDKEIQADTVLIHRVLENIMNNALRYACREICLDFTLSDHRLTIMVMDDGEGFSPGMLKQGERKLLTAREDGHMGIGLSVSRLLCKKHGGGLELSNVSGGACVKIIFSV